MSRDGATAFVTSTEGKFVSVIDAASRTVKAKIDMPDTPLGVAVDPSGAFIYVSGFYSPRIYKIDVATAAIVDTPSVGASPSGVAVSPDGALIVVADRDDDALSFSMPRTSKPKLRSRSARILRRHHRRRGPAGLYGQCRKRQRVGGRSFHAKADRDGAGRKAALCRRPRERARLYERPIWRDGFGFRP